MATKKSTTAAAVKKSPRDKEAPIGKDDGKGGDKSVILDKPVSLTDQSMLGATTIEEDELEAAHDWNATNRDPTPSWEPTIINNARDNSPYAGQSAPRTWSQIYRENATDIDIRAGAKAKIEKPKE